MNFVCPLFLQIKSKIGLLVPLWREKCSVWNKWKWNDLQWSVTRTVAVHNFPKMPFSIEINVELLQNLRSKCHTWRCACVYTELLPQISTFLDRLGWNSAQENPFWRHLAVPLKHVQSNPVELILALFPTIFVPFGYNYLQTNIHTVYLRSLIVFFVKICAVRVILYLNT